LLGEQGQARAFFEDALKVSPGGGLRAEVLAYLAYEHALAKDHARAVAYGEQAILAGGRTPAVLNNLAYCLLRGRKGDADNLASGHLDRAIESDGNLLAAHNNRAWLVYMRRQRSGERLPTRVGEDIDQAIALSAARGRPESAELYRRGALIHARAALDVAEQQADDRERHEALTRRYAARAYALGLSAETITAEPNLAKVLGKDFDPRIDPDKKEVKRERETPLAGQDTYLAEPRAD
jgi:hypothetical protein